MKTFFLAFGFPVVGFCTYEKETIPSGSIVRDEWCGADSVQQRFRHVYAAGVDQRRPGSSRYSSVYKQVIHDCRSNPASVSNTSRAVVSPGLFYVQMPRPALPARGKTAFSSAGFALGIAEKSAKLSP